MYSRFEVISHPNIFRLRLATWIDIPDPGTTVQYLYYSDSIASWRKGVRGGRFVWDKTLTALGFDGVENTDWENVRVVGTP